MLNTLNEHKKCSLFNDLSFLDVIDFYLVVEQVEILGSILIATHQ